MEVVAGPLLWLQLHVAKAEKVLPSHNNEFQHSHKNRQTHDLGIGTGDKYTHTSEQLVAFNLFNNII